MAHVVAAVVSPTLAKAQVLVVALAPIACRLGMSVSPAVTTAAAVHEPSFAGLNLRRRRTDARCLRGASCVRRRPR